MIKNKTTISCQLIQKENTIEILIRLSYTKILRKNICDQVHFYDSSKIEENVVQSLILDS